MGRSGLSQRKSVIGAMFDHSPTEKATPESLRFRRLVGVLCRIREGEIWSRSTGPPTVCVEEDRSASGSRHSVSLADSCRKSLPPVTLWDCVADVERDCLIRLF